MTSLFSKEISNFFSNNRSLNTTLPFIANVLNNSKKNARTALESYLKEHAVKKEINKDNPNVTTYILPPEHSLHIRRLNVRSSNAQRAIHQVPESFMVTLISQYDAFLGSILQALYFKKPDLINNSEKNLSFNELSNFLTVEDIRKFTIEREIDSIMRESHAEQISIIERKLGMTLTKDLTIWPTFIEITERRNLFVHTGGRVTNQYIKVCKQFKVEIPEQLKAGDILSIDRSYFDNACDVVLELGMKLGHVLWRKVADDEREEADSNLNILCYELIHAEEYQLAATLLEFATETLKKHSTEEIFMYLTINKAQAYKWSKEQDRCTKTLNSIDWTAKAPKYQLVRYVLLDQFDEAAKIMRTIGSEGNLGIPAYVEWPVFQKFRQSEIFKNAYQEIFGMEFQIIGTTETETTDVKKNKKFID